MNRGKESRLEVQERRSPLMHHSMNQIKGTLGFQGEIRMEQSSRDKRQRKRSELKKVEEQVATLPFSAVVFNLAIESAREGSAPKFLNAYLKTHLRDFEKNSI